MSRLRTALLALGIAVAPALVLPAFDRPLSAQPASPLDGEWRGTSDGGSCNAPLDFLITIEAGLVDGSAFDTTARGPQPNLKKAPPPPPGAGLWQIFGVARGDSFTLSAVASTKASNRRSGKLNVAVRGGTMTVTESGGCGRTARLSRS